MCEEGGGRCVYIALPVVFGKSNRAYVELLGGNVFTHIYFIITALLMT